MVERNGVSASPCQGREEDEMAPTPQWRFGPFCLDPASGCLWRAETLVPLRPKPFALLAYLVAHTGQVVSKARLFEAVWPETMKSSMRGCRERAGRSSIDRSAGGHELESAVAAARQTRGSLCLARTGLRLVHRGF